MKYKLLVVEDDSIIAEDICLTLERLGYEVAGTAESGEEAIKKAASLQPSLVLMDIVLKGTVDGIKAASHIIKNLDIPVVYLTSHSDVATFKRAKETGPFGYMMKPFEERDLGATVEMALYKHAMESQLKGKEQWLTIILKSMGDGVIVTDADGRVRFMNPASEGIIGCSVRECTGRAMNEILQLQDEGTGEPLPDPIASIREGLIFSNDGGIRMIRMDGGQISVDGSAYPIRDEDGSISGAVFVFRDVTEQRRALKMIEESERFLNTIFDSIHDPFCIIDRDYNLVRANDAYAKIKGKPLDKLIGSKCYSSIHGTSKICKDCIVERTFAEAKPQSKERPQIFVDSTKGWVEIFTYPIFDEDGRVSHIIEYTRDISERRKLDEERKVLIEELEYLSTVDPLSGLLNRRALMNFLNNEVDRAKRYNRKLSLILCDVDRFKSINDSLGHSAGDEAIRHVAEVLTGVLRKSDVVGRYGGDEFMVVMPETTGKGAVGLAERLRTAMKEKTFMPTPKDELGLTLSLGVAILNVGTDTVDTFVTRADAALYESKREGRDRVTSFGG